MFNYLDKCGWLFDGLFSHWLLNSSFDWQIQRSAEGFSQAARVLPAQGALAPSAACENPSTDC